MQWEVGDLGGHVMLLARKLVPAKEIVKYQDRLLVGGHLVQVLQILSHAAAHAVHVIVSCHPGLPGAIARLVSDFDVLIPGTIFRVSLRRNFHNH